MVVGQGLESDVGAFEHDRSEHLLSLADLALPALMSSLVSSLMSALRGCGSAHLPQVPSATLGARSIWSLARAAGLS